MSASAPRRCVPRADAPQENRNPFPVFPGEPRVLGPIKKSRMGRRRAIVLGAVHVLVLAHVAHWLTRGRTVSPVEPSESMRTLELGEINAGFVFFALAIVSTLLLGRFFCGWGCHIVALQDLCGWLMKRAGVRPRPFRSRLLVWAPLLLALYMFVWPGFKRVALVPALGAVAPGLAASIAPPPFPGFSNHLTTEHFWETFPGLLVAIPFFGICGFATVYLLGAKGFCTYGCPYGGFFGVADKFAPGRIRVTDACEHCGHCTAVCTSNVRVHDEVRRFGMVVDPGCMKCMDCVSTCPNDALYFGFGPTKRGAGKKAGRGAGRGPRYDLGGREEIVLGALFLVTLVAVRGVYDAVPFLMAVGIAACVPFLVWTAKRLVTDRSVHLQSLALKDDGRLRRAGAVLAAVVVLAVVFVGQSGFVRWHRAQGEKWDRRVAVPAAPMFEPAPPEVAPRLLAAAERAARHYRLADRIGAGGVGLVETPEVVVRRAWLDLVLDRPHDAARQLRRVLAGRGPEETVRFDLARVLFRAGELDEASRELASLIAASPAEPRFHRQLARVREAAGDREGAVSELVVVVNLAPDDGASRARLVRLLEELGREDDADRYRRPPVSP